MPQLPFRYQALVGLVIAGATALAGTSWLAKGVGVAFGVGVALYSMSLEKPEKRWWG